MRKLLLSSCFLLLIALNAKAQEKTSLGIIPAPVKLEVQQGAFHIPKRLSVKFSGFTTNTTNLQNFVTRIFSTETTQENGQKGISISIDKSSPIKEEGYLLAINHDGITIKSASEKGAFYGLQTLAQLWFFNGVKSQTLPFVKIEDYPRFSYRGMHLDVGRHMFPVSFIKEYIDMLAFYKLNTFHWHLTEDQGWRVEIKKISKINPNWRF